MTNTLQHSISPAYFSSNGRYVEFTPPMNCIVEVRAYESRQWGYDGGDCKVSVSNISGLTKTNSVDGCITGGNTIGRSISAVAIFKNAKKGTKYKASYTLTNGGSNGDSSAIFVICYPAQYSISRATGADGTVGGGATYTMKNGIVVIVIRNSTLTGNVMRTLGQVPSDMCPQSVIYGALNYSQYAGFVCVDVNGTVTAFAPYTGDYTGQVVYCVQLTVI